MARISSRTKKLGEGHEFKKNLPSALLDFKHGGLAQAHPPARTAHNISKVHCLF